MMLRLVSILCVLALPPTCLEPVFAVDKRTRQGELGWPPDAPRVVLESEISTRPRSPLGTFFHRFSGKRSEPLFDRPYGVAWDGEDLLVTDPGGARVLRIDARGRSIRSQPGVFESPIGVAACAAGTFVSDSRLGKIALLDEELRLLRWVADGVARPTGVSCAGDRLFVVETTRHRVLVFEPVDDEVDSAGPSGSVAEAGYAAPAGEDASGSGRPVRRTRVLGARGEEPGEFNFPTVLGTGSGALWVGDTLNFRIQRFDMVSGRFEGAFGRLGDAAGEMPRIKGLAVDAEGRIWVSDAHLDQIALYDVDGEFLMSIGGSGGRPGEFSFPVGIAAHPDGRMAVVDSLNRRLQIFRLVSADRMQSG